MITEERLKEEWKDIPQFAGRYSVSNYGEIKSNDYKIYHNGKKENPHSQIVKGKKLKQSYNKDYARIRLINNNGERKNYLVHRIVAEIFVPNPQSKQYVNHIDGNKKNNYFENLEWVTASENAIHSYGIGLSKVTEKTRKSARETAIKRNKSRCKEVYQYDKNYNLLNSFPSLKDASEKLNISKTCISEVCHRKQKSSNGYLFSYNLIKKEGSDE